MSEATSGDQGLIHSQQTGANVAVCYRPDDRHLIAAAPDMLKALQRITHPAADDTDLEFALQVIDQATAVQP
jgi:hypothetical protein